jgi:hypothetical protein
LLKLAVWTLSGSGVVVPFVIVTQMGLLLVAIQPVANPTEIPEDTLVPVMLYIAVNRRPVVGGVVSTLNASREKWIVSDVSPDEQAWPVTFLPPIHSTMILVDPGTMVPVVSTPTGRRTVWFACRVMSKPSSAAELLT